MYQFTKKYNTFEDWALHQPASTSYTRRIAYLHDKHPEATLSQLRGHAKKGEFSLYMLRPRECTSKNMSEFAQLARDFVAKSHCILFDEDGRVKPWRRPDDEPQ
jgi:hypothetical protein